MTRFDEILPKLTEILERYRENIRGLGHIVVNRDLNGRVCLVVSKVHRGEEVLKHLAEEIQNGLQPHAFPHERLILFEEDIEHFVEEELAFPFSDAIENIFIVDRLAMEGDWGEIATETTKPSRIVFYSMKGGVGRSTALAVTAWSLAERGHRVMVLDLDLESPGLSTFLLPADRRPSFGITDWLVEDLVDNGDAVLDSMVATSDLSRNGEILVVPAHGNDPGEYVSKLGRIWMPKVTKESRREPWFRRLDRLSKALEEKWKPDVVLIDSRAGIDEVASTCLTDLRASLVLLFAVDGDQTWSGYRILFQHWRRVGVVRQVRERLQLVGAMIPETGTLDYLQGLRERAWDLFSEELYDEILPGTLEEDLWSYDLVDETAPHWPWRVNWHRGFAALRSVHGRLYEINATLVNAVFGDLLKGVVSMLDEEDGS